MRRYGWKPDPEDRRDRHFKLHRYGKIEPVIDLSEGISRVYDQGPLGSCVGHGVGSLYRFVIERQKGKPFDPSRLFIYYEARKRIGKVNQDSGAHIRDAMKVIAKLGVCDEAYWPYDTRKFKAEPSKQAYVDAETHQAIEYSKITWDIFNGIRACHSEGYPTVLGMKVFESFESSEVAKSGILKMPEPGEREIGGHCIMTAGHSDIKQTYCILNSYGQDWGRGGFFDVPYEYVKKYASDIWTLRETE